MHSNYLCAASIYKRSLSTTFPSLQHSPLYNLYNTHLIKTFHSLHHPLYNILLTTAFPPNNLSLSSTFLSLYSIHPCTTFPSLQPFPFYNIPLYNIPLSTTFPFLQHSTLSNLSLSRTFHSLQYFPLYNIPLLTTFTSLQHFLLYSIHPCSTFPSLQFYNL